MLFCKIHYEVVKLSWRLIPKLCHSIFGIKMWQLFVSLCFVILSWKHCNISVLGNNVLSLVHILKLTFLFTWQTWNSKGCCTWPCWCCLCLSSWLHGCGLFLSTNFSMNWMAFHALLDVDSQYRHHHYHDHCHHHNKYLAISSIHPSPPPPPPPPSPMPKL